LWGITAEVCNNFYSMEAGLAVIIANIHIGLTVNTKWFGSLAVACLKDT